MVDFQYPDKHRGHNVHVNYATLLDPLVYYLDLGLPVRRSEDSEKPQHEMEGFYIMVCISESG